MVSQARNLINVTQIGLTNSIEAGVAFKRIKVKAVMMSGSNYVLNKQM